MQFHLIFLLAIVCYKIYPFASFSRTILFSHISTNWQSLLYLIVFYYCLGIEAEAVMLGQAISMLLPEVIGYKLTGKLNQYATSTDLVLTITKVGVK